jgi:hypothetical protein
MRMLLAAILVLAGAAAAQAQYGTRSRSYDSFGGNDYGSTSFPTGRYVTPHYNSHGGYVGGHFTPDSTYPKPRDSSRSRDFNLQTRPYGTPSSRY